MRDWTWWGLPVAGIGALAYRWLVQSIMKRDWRLKREKDEEIRREMLANCEEPTDPWALD